MKLAPLTAEQLPAFADLLGGPGFGGCFCAIWRSFGPDWAARCADPSRPNLAATRAAVLAGHRPGFLVRDGGRTVAWTGAGPRSGFPLLHQRLGARCSTRGPETWLLGCLAIAPDHRGRGLGERIVRAVMARAKAEGARYVEACPTDPWDEPRSYRGSLSMYRRLGFVEVAREADGDGHVLLVEAGLE